MRQEDSVAEGNDSRVEETSVSEGNGIRVSLFILC